MNKFIKVLIVIILFIMVSGGVNLRGYGFKLDLTNIDIFGLLLLITLIYGKLFKKQFYEISFIKIQERIKILCNREDANRNLLICLGFFGSVTFIGHSFKQFSFNSHGLDQVFMHQPLFYPFFKDKILFCSVCPNLTFFGEHINFTFLLVTPLTSLIKSDILIYFINVLILYGGLYLLIKRGPLSNKRELWLVIALIALSSRTFRNAGLWELREDHFAFFFMCLMLLSLYKDRMLFYTISTLGVLVSKENMAFLIPFMSFPIIFDFNKIIKNRKILYVLITILMSIIWYKVSFGYVSPLFNEYQQPTANIVDRFDGIATSTSSLIYKMLTDFNVQKKLITQRILNYGTFKYLLILLFPFLLALYRKPYWLIAASPILGMNVLSYASAQRMMIFHYDLVIIPIFIFATANYLKNNSRNSVVVLIMALALSGRWPSHFIVKYFPTVNSIQRVLYLNEKSHLEYIGTDWKKLGYLSRSKFVTPVSYEPKTYQDFIKFNMNKSFYNGNFSLIEYLILDRNIGQENNALEYLINNKWIKLEEFEGLVLLRKKS